MGRRAVAALAAALLLAACGGDDDAGVQPHSHDHDHGHSHESTGSDATEFAFGAPGDPAEATRTIEVTTSDPYRFEPAAVEVGSGETVTFVVTNEGDEEHEFVLGDVSYQEQHGEEMAAGSMHHEGNAVTVAPGDTEELTWTFPPQGDVLFACHVGGHYAAGMVGVITISA